MMTDVNVLALDNQVCFTLYAANRAVTARYRPLLAELDLTYPQYLVMLVLWEESSAVVRVSWIGQRLRLDSGTVTPLLKRLAQRGLITRARSEADERVVLIELTAKGANLKALARSVPPRLFCGTGLDPARMTALRDELRSLLHQLEASSGQDVSDPESEPSAL